MGKYSEYKVQLASLPEGKFEQDFECNTEFFKNMENPDITSANVKIHLDGVHKNDAYDMTFHCKGILEIPCDRCLDPIEHEVDTTYHLIVEFGEEYNDASEDVLVIPYSDHSLNVAYILYDTIVLTIPMRHIHPLGKCNRAMADTLKKHRAAIDDDIDDADLELDSVLPDNS